MALRSDQIREGRYFQGGDVDSTPNTIEWWESATFTKSPSDISITITPKYAGRPWLLAYDAYGKSWLGWFILLYNNIVDDTQEFVEGKEIILPTAQRLFQEILTRSTASSTAIQRK